MTDDQDMERNPTQPLPRQDQVTDAGEETGAPPPPHAHVLAVAAAPSEPPPDRRRSGLLGVLVGIALVLSIASLVLSLAIISSLSNAQRAAVERLDSAIHALDNLEGEGFQYEFRFEQTIPVQSSIPIEEEIIIPFSGDFPIDTEVQVPIDAGILGTFMVDVPINTSVQVDTEVPIRVDQTFEISTSIPVSMVIPISVGPEDPAIQRGVENLRTWLVDLRESLDAGLSFPFLGD